MDRKRSGYFFFAVCFTALLFLPSRSDCSVVERCRKYQPQVIREANYHIGVDAPAHYFMGQIEQESRCNEGVTAFDGGMGLGQFMPQTAEWIQGREKSLQELSYNPYDPKWSIRALVLYDRWLYQKTACEGWYYAFRSYNGGLGNLKKEITCAGDCVQENIESCCKRRILKLKKSMLDLCKVNIEYPYLIFKRSEKYAR